jgi:glycosyltransferase involved in cell wall biosynthesis
MNLGFYYHLPLYSTKEGLKIPAYLGVFLDYLAQEVTSLILFLHEAKINEIKYCDYTLKSNNIRFYSLGPKTPSWDRFLRPGKTLRKLRNAIYQCDVVLVRAPSPLAPSFYRYYHSQTNICYLVVGDYRVGSDYLSLPFFKNIAGKFLNIRNDRQLMTVLRKSLTLVNSTELYEKYEDTVPRLFKVRTTTISQADFYVRSDTCLGNVIDILYTGRLDMAKGLKELVQSISILRTENFNVRLHLVGWEENSVKPVEKILHSLAVEYGVSQQVFFHGRKAMGAELNYFYRNSDIYAIPSYHEGFPRSIWEAMANGLPVIASNVGSIKSFVGDSAILIEPKKVTELVSAVKILLSNPIKRRELIAAGYLRAKENILEIRVKEISDIIKNIYPVKD